MSSGALTRERVPGEDVLLALLNCQKAGHAPAAVCYVTCTWRIARSALNPHVWSTARYATSAILLSARLIISDVKYAGRLLVQTTAALARTATEKSAVIVPSEKA